MAEKNSPAANAAQGELIITRIFHAPRELVWKAWTDPKHLMRWWGPKDFTSPVCKIDFRVGGKYLFCMRSSKLLPAPPGSPPITEGQEFWSTGVYREIVPLKRIVCTDSFADEKGNVVPASHYGMPGDDWPLEFIVTVTFEDAGGTTTMTLRHAGFPAGEMGKMAGAGWNESFDKLAESLREMSDRPIVIERTYDASVETVWKALTDKDQIKQWSFDIKEFRPEVGFEFRFYGGTEEKQYLHLCKVLEVVKLKKLQYSWRYDGYEGNSIVTFELVAEGKKTRVRLTHEGLESFPKSNPDLARKNFEEGWTSIIGSSLKEFVETNR